MTDEELIARLRDACRGGDGCKCSLSEAADRIEALKADLKSVLDRESATYARHDAKVERLEAALVKERERCAKAGGDKAVEILLRNEPNAGLLKIQTTRQAIAAAIRATLKGDDHD